MKKNTFTLIGRHHRDLGGNAVARAFPRPTGRLGNRMPVCSSTAM